MQKNILANKKITWSDDEERLLNSLEKKKRAYEKEQEIISAANHLKLYSDFIENGEFSEVYFSTETLFSESKEPIGKEISVRVFY